MFNVNFWSASNEKSERKGNTSTRRSDYMQKVTLDLGITTFVQTIDDNESTAVCLRYANVPAGKNSSSLSFCTAFLVATAGLTIFV